MQITTRQYVSALFGLLLVVGVATVMQVTGDTHVIAQPNTVSQPVHLATSTLPLRVSGVVTAADSSVIHAQVAGVVTSLPVREGATVSPGMRLAEQATPVLDAKRARAAAETKLTALQSEQDVTISAANAERGVITARSAVETAALRKEAQSDRVQEAATTLHTTLKENVVTIIAAANYVNTHRDLFNAEGLRRYDEVVATVYGRMPSYFQSGAVQTAETTIDLQALIESIAFDADGVVTMLPTAATATAGQLEALAILMKTAESDVFDRGSARATETQQEEYLAQRSAVLSARQTLADARASYAQQLDAVLEDAVAQDTTVATRELDAEIATTEAAYARDIRAANAALLQASEAVVAAEQSQARPTAPFAGTIAKVHVDVGTYVTPGTPLMTLIGTAARELAVTVPAAFLSQVTTGDEFRVDGTVVGFVERYSTVTEGGSGTVIISLHGESVPMVGQSMMGTLELSPDDAVYAVPRSHVHFDADGPFLRYVSGERAEVTVLYDAGDRLYLKVGAPRELPLAAATSIAL